MALIYRTSDGDALDWICWKQYGRVSGTVEAVLEANPGLADRGAVYDAGLKIILPDLPTATQRNLVRLWD